LQSFWQQKRLKKEGGNLVMIFINVKENESLDRALKKFKKKFEKTGVVKEMRARQAFIKPCIKNREQRIKAAYKLHLQQQEQG
jgi:small subunit ribosomal protein S21